MLDSANSCPYGKWIGEVTDQPVMYVANAAKVGATTGAVRLQASTKVGAIDDFAADLKEISKIGTRRTTAELTILSSHLAWVAPSSILLGCFRSW